MSFVGGHHPFSFLMIRLRLWLLLLLFMLLPPALPAQREQYHFSQADIRQGLSHNQVSCFVKDRQGFLWAGTASGLNRYDGYSFKVLLNSAADTNSLPDNAVNELFECPGNKLWVVSRSAVSVYNPLTEQFNRRSGRYLQSLGLPQDSVIRITRNTAGNYWFVLANAGLYQYNTTQQKAVKIKNTAAPGVAAAVSAIAGDAGGNSWVVYRNGLLQYINDSSLQVMKEEKALYNNAPGSNRNYRLFVDAQGALWLWLAGEPAGAFYVNPATGQFIHFNTTNAVNRIRNDLVTGITQDRDGVIWLATDHGGVNLVHPSDHFSVSYLLNDPEDNTSLGQNSINVLYKDYTGVIWIGTYKQGISYFNQNITQFPRYRHSNSNTGSLPYDDVNRFAEDAKGNIWIGTNGGGLIYFNRQTGSFTQYLHDATNDNSIGNNVIVSLWIDHNQQLWIGSYYGGLDCYDGSRFIHYRHNDAIPGSLSDDRVWEIYEDRSGALWVGTLNGGLNRLNRQTQQFDHFTTAVPGTVQSNYIAALLEDQAGNLWIGTSGGVDVLNAARNKFDHYAHGDDVHTLSHNNVLCLLQTKNGYIWAGTQEGLCLYDKARKGFYRYTVADGLPDNIILTLSEDQQGSCWITTPKGMCSLVMDAENNDPAHPVFHVRQFNEINHLQGMEFNENAALVTRKGELVVGGPGGFNIIDPAAIQPRETEAGIVFTGLQVFNGPVAPGKPVRGRVILPQSISATDIITLHYNENVFTIEFAALGFANSSKDRYAYQLEGFNKDWLYTDGSSRKATFTNLDPGTYYLKVRAATSDGLWSGQVRTLKIVIQPPFWKTPLAFILYGLFVIAVIILARRLTLERAHMRFEVVQQRREAERIQAMDVVKTKFFTNVSHEFRTPLGLILSPLDRIIKNTGDADQKKQLQLVQRNAKRLLNLVNQLLDFRKMEVQEFRLQLTRGDIIRVIRDACYSFSDVGEKKNIELSFRTNREVLDTWFDKDKLEKILFNLLSNAFKYTHAYGKVSVEVIDQENAGNDAIDIIVKDSGIGIPQDQQDKIFERFFQYDVPDNLVNHGSGIGLAITREFVKLHNGTIRVSSVPEQGTTFTVTLPVKKENEVLPVTPLLMETILAVQDAGAPGKDETTETGSRRKRETILLVEDDEDFRFYLKDNLSLHYQVVELSNGKEAWDKINDIQPDIVVSDIMMPVMNGLDLARKIKKDARTSHIPVVLLTAMAGEEAQLEGYQLGVQDYITKPFTFEILASRIRNLLAQQKQLRKNFQRQVEVNPSEVTITPLDEQFMKDALQCVEKHLSSPGFTVEEMSRELHMSRVVLYRKLVSLTGETPIEFIRTIRLKRAAQLLGKSQLTVAEVAYQVGFNNPKIFSRYFKEQFGMLPSEYRKQGGTE